MTIQMRFGLEDLVLNEGKRYRVSRNDDLIVCFQAIDVGNEGEICFTQDQLMDLIKSERLEHQRRGLSKGKVVAHASLGAQNFTDFSSRAVAKALWRQKWCEAFDRLYRDGQVKKSYSSVNSLIPEMAREVNALEETVQAGGVQAQAGRLVTSRKPPCPKSLLSWHKKYLMAERDPKILLLGSHRSGNSIPRFCLDARSLLQECVQKYLDLKRPSKMQIVRQSQETFRLHNLVLERKGEPQLSVPSRAEIYREINRLRPFDVCAARHGVDHARRRYALFENGNDVQYPLERVEIDEWKVDLRTVATRSGIWKSLSKQEQAKFPRERRWLYVAIDCATRCVVGLKVASIPSAQEAIWTLDQVTRDKSVIAKAVGAAQAWEQFGGLEVVATDNGASYANEEFEAAVSDAGGVAHRPPAGLPHLRAMVERVFGTFATELMPHLPGRTYANSKERGDADPRKSAVLTDDFLTALLVRYVVDVYHLRAHEGLGGHSPANRWKTLAKKYGVMVPPTPNARRAAFGDRLERTIRGNGIRIAGVYYKCAELEEAFLGATERKVQVRMDTADIGCVSVKIGSDWFPAKSVLDGFDGVSLQAWTAKKRALEMSARQAVELDQPTVDKALSDIEQMVSDAYDLSHVMPERVEAASIVSASEKQFIGLKQELDFDDVDASDAMLRNTIPVKPSSVPQRPQDDLEFARTELRWRFEE
ncbi:MAG: Mu transposase C-terminal domain-containing protein [Hyphomicrobiales bacterium]